MTVTWDDATLVQTDDGHDQEYASNGHSRYGEYLRLNGNLFRSAWSDEPAPVEDPVEFAVHAWRVASGPIMAPGYLRVRPDLHGITLHRDDVDGHLYADVRVPLRHYHLGSGSNRFPYAWQDWATEHDFGAGKYDSLREPDTIGNSPSVLASAVVRVPGRGWTDLVKPTAYEGRMLTDEARAAVAVVARYVNQAAGLVVAKLLE